MSRATAVVFAMAERGHFMRLLPVVDGLVRAGVETHVFTSARFAHEVARAGGRFVDLFAEHSVDAADAESIPVPCRFVSFAGCFGEAIVKAATAFAPSLVVHDTFAVIGQVVANHLGVPRVNVCAGHNLAPGPTRDALSRDPRVRVSDACWRAVRRLRERHGIPEATPFSYIDGVSADLNLYCEPPQFLLPEERAPFEPIAFFGSLWPEGRPSSSTPQWGKTAASAHVRLYVSFGTVIWRYYAPAAQAVLDALATALAGRDDIEAVVSLGGSGSLTPIGSPTPGNMRIEPYVDQWQMLREASVVLTHHGLNSTHEAIYYRVPMISYPFFADQPGLAARSQALGLAVPLVGTLQGPTTADDMHVAFDRIAASRQEMIDRLTTARQWELDTIRARPAIVERMLALTS